MKLLINSQISTFAPLKFGNGYFISLHTLMDMWVPNHAESWSWYVLVKMPMCCVITLNVSITWFACYCFEWLMVCFEIPRGALGTAISVRWILRKNVQYHGYPATRIFVFELRAVYIGLLSMEPKNLFNFNFWHTNCKIPMDHVWDIQTPISYVIAFYKNGNFCIWYLKWTWT